jgi:pimeloyl-ACP methyl ester carboxylesterase
MEGIGKYRLHGKPPYKTVLVHGGPGGAGELEILSKDLSVNRGILEPFQRSSTVKGQIDELIEMIESICRPPVSIVGFSWGAWLSWLAVSEREELFSRLILLSSPPFDGRYSISIMKTRMSRLTADERREVMALNTFQQDASSFRRFADMMTRADTYDGIEDLEQPRMELDRDINECVWKEAVSMRRSGELLRSWKDIRIPTFVIHGREDPHPFEGVVEPHSKIGRNFELHILDRCGHRPWIEKHARSGFMKLMERLLD